MSLTNDEVLHVARLSNLSLTPREVEKFKTQLSGVIDYIQELSEVDVSGVLPTTQTTGLVNVSREDIIETTSILSEEEALSGTDKTHNGYFIVPHILSHKP